MDNCESLVLEYLRADRSVFVNTQCCIQLFDSPNPDKSGPHWYCDLVLRDPLINPPVHSHLLRAAQLEPWPLLRGIL